MFHGSILGSSPANSNQESIVLDTDSAVYGSFQFTWVSLTTDTAIAAVIQVFVSDDNINWVNKSGANYVIETTDGTESISLNGVLTEQYVKVSYTATGVTGGTIFMSASVKGK